MDNFGKYNNFNVPGKSGVQRSGDGQAKGQEHAEGQQEEQKAPEVRTNFLSAEEVFKNLNNQALQQKESLQYKQISKSLADFTSNEAHMDTIAQWEAAIRSEFPGHSDEEYALIVSEAFVNENLGVPSIAPNAS